MARIAERVAMESCIVLEAVSLLCIYVNLVLIFVLTHLGFKRKVPKEQRIIKRMYRVGRLEVLKE